MSRHRQQPLAPAVLFGVLFRELLELSELFGLLSERMPLAELPLLPAPEPVVSLVPAVGLLLRDGLAASEPLAAMPLEAPQGRLLSERLTSDGDLTPGVAAPVVPGLVPIVPDEPPPAVPPLPAPAASTHPILASMIAAANESCL